MLNKFIFCSFLMGLLTESCNSSAPQIQTNNSSNTVDSMAQRSVVQYQQRMDSLPMIPCAAILKTQNAKDMQKIYSDTMTFDNTHLLFVTRDSALHLYRQKDNNCAHLLKIPLDSTDLYSYRDGSPLFLRDLDGDNQNEILVTVEKNGNHSNFRVFRLVKEKDHIALKKIPRFEEFTNPEYDKESRMVRVHWSDRGNYELDEYYRLSKDDVLQFVKGMKRSSGKETTYTTKKGW